MAPDPTSCPCSFELHVHKLSGEVVMSRTCSPMELVKELKKAISKVMGIPVGEQKLIWEAEELMDSCGLGQYSFFQGAQVMLLQIDPMMRWVRMLTESSGNGIRSRLARRDALENITQIARQTPAGADPEVIGSLLPAVYRSQVGTGRFDGDYLDALRHVAAGTGDQDVVDVFTAHIAWLLAYPHTKAEVLDFWVGALFSVLNLSGPPQPPENSFALCGIFSRCARRGSMAARKYMTKLMKDNLL